MARESLFCGVFTVRVSWWGVVVALLGVRGARGARGVVRSPKVACGRRRCQVVRGGEGHTFALPRWAGLFRARFLRFFSSPFSVFGDCRVVLLFVVRFSLVLVYLNFVSFFSASLSFFHL
jgi:hypothetical protein